MESPLYSAADKPDLRLIETVLWNGTACPLLEGHLARLSNGARGLGWPLDLNFARAALTGPQGQPRCLRLLLDAKGQITVGQQPVPAPIDCWRLGLASQQLLSDDPWLCVKSSHRPIYNEARSAIPEGIDELILTNERGEICDGTITTIFFDRGEGLRTPPLASGLLPGVLRADMIARGACSEEVLLVGDLPNIRIWVGNALRGVSSATWTGVELGTTKTPTPGQH